MKRIFPKGTHPEDIAHAVLRMTQQLPTNKAWAVTVEEWKKPRTNQQNSYLFGVVYPCILEAGGEALAGWQKEELHTYFLSEWGGSETYEGFGRVFHRPVRRSSKLTTQEFSDYLTFLEIRCADMGIIIPDVNYEG